MTPTDESDAWFDHIWLPKRVRRGLRSLDDTYTGSSAEHLWSRLNALDFINKGMLFAAVLLLCFFPFIIVANALAGQSAVTGLVRHLGLNQQAASDVSALFTSSSATSNAVTGTAYLFFLLGGIAAASAVQDLYERSFELDAGGFKDIFRRFVWLAVTVGWVSLAAVAGPWLHDAVGLWLVAILGFLGLTLFWWGTMWFLLSSAGLVASPLAVRGGNRALLGGNGGGVLVYLLGNCHFGRQKVRPDWRCVRSHVLADSHRCRHHSRSSGRTGLARTRSLLLQGLPLAPAIVGPKEGRPSGFHRESWSDRQAFVSVSHRFVDTTGIRTHAVGSMPPRTSGGIRCFAWPQTSSGWYRCWEGLLHRPRSRLGRDLSVSSTLVFRLYVARGLALPAPDEKQKFVWIATRSPQPG